jgi:hypothetical protein
MDILRHLERSNCRECGLDTCMAFASAVVQGTRALADCPRLDRGVVEELSGGIERTLETAQADRDAMIERLRGIVRGVDLPGAARRVGGAMRGDRIEIRCLGKRFELDASGELHSECHVNPWVHLPLLHYVAHGRGRPIEGEWVPFRDLPGARDWARFFEHRCEAAIRRIADVDPDLFLDTLDLFDGEPISKGTGEIYSSADDVLVLHPMPRVPMLVAYWHAGGEFASRLSLLFDTTAGENLGAEAIFRLGTGIVEMLSRIMARHGHAIGPP